MCFQVVMSVVVCYTALKNKYTLKCALKPYPLLGSFVLTVAKSRKLASYGHLEKKDPPHGLQGPAQWIPAPTSAPSLPHAPWLHLQRPSGFLTPILVFSCLSAFTKIVSSSCKFLTFFRNFLLESVQSTFLWNIPYFPD